MRVSRLQVHFLLVFQSKITHSTRLLASSLAHFLRRAMVSNFQATADRLIYHSEYEQNSAFRSTGLCVGPAVAMRNAM